MKKILYFLSLAMGMPLALWAQWLPNGTPICTTANKQQYPTIIYDGGGNYYISWRDRRSGNTDIYAQKVNNAGTVLWQTNGVAVCTATGEQISPKMALDGKGGVIITWYDNRRGNYDIFAQRLDQNGNALWTPNGVAVCTTSSTEYMPQIVSDGSGGAIIAWYYENIYAQRLDSLGAIKWNPNGAPICTLSGSQEDVRLISDGNGGAFLGWFDARLGPSNTDTYVQRIDSMGVPLWQANGFPVCNATLSQGPPTLISDGWDGIIAAWGDGRNGNADIYAQRVDPGGTAAWNINGEPVYVGAFNQYSSPALVSDGNHGAICIWLDDRNGNYDIYGQHIDDGGNTLWSSDGIAITTTTTCMDFYRVESDDAYGAIVAWHDSRNGASNLDIYAQRVSVSGDLEWTSSGLPICTSLKNQSYPALASDGTGRTVVAWTDSVNGNLDIFAQKVSGTGYVGNPPPELIEPPDSSCINIYMPGFAWHSVADADRYRLHVAKSSLFLVCTIDTVLLGGDTTLLATLPAQDDVYFWRVKAYMPGYSDSSAWSEVWNFRTDIHPPNPPPNLRANGQSPSPWTANQSFNITFDTLELDPSGIKMVFYKLGTRPTSNGDCTDSLLSSSFSVPASVQGGESLFVWCRDKAGNTSYLNNSSVVLRWDQAPPEAEVHVPNGTEIWTAGETDTITFAHFDSCVIAYDSLYYSTNSGGSWTPIFRVYPPDTLKAWQVPSTPSTACRVKVVVRDSAGNRIEDISNNDFTILLATTPTLAIDFTTWNPPPEGGDTLLHVYNSGDAVVIPFLVSGDSAWLWPIPDSGATPQDIGIHTAPNYSSSVRIGHITVVAPGFNGSPQVVTITQASLDTVHPWASITNPQPGETKYCGTNLNITWSEGDNVGVIQDSLEYSLDGGATWIFIDKGPIPANGYVWPVPNAPTAQAMVRVIVTDSAGNAGQGASGLFTIADSTKPTVSVTAPDTGEVWTTGSNRTISWNQDDNVGVLRDSVVFSPDYGANWEQVYAGPATASFLWTVPNVHSASCLIRVVAVDSTGNQGYSNSGTFEVRDTIPPQVTAITSPAAGAVWGIGTLREISWQQQDNVSIAVDSLLYSTDGGGSWTFIDSTGSGTNYQWTVPGPASADCRVKVVARDAGGNLGELASGLFTITDATQPYLGVNPLLISIPSAGGGDSVAVTNSGNDSIFAFTASCDSAWAALSSAGGSTPGGFSVNADSNLSGLARSALVIVAAAGIPGSPDTVLLTQQAIDLTAPACTLHAPNGGEALNVGQSFLARWSQADAGGIARDTLLYTSNGGSTWNFVWTGRDTSCLWTVPNTPSANCAVRLIVRDSSGNRAMDNSDAFFSIADGAPPTVTVNEALSGATLYCGSSHTLQWAQNDNIAVTGDSVYLSTDNQASWVPVAGLPPATSYQWTVPHQTSINCYIKVVASDGAGNKGWDVNNYAFSIIDTLRPSVDLISPNGGENWYGGTVHAISWNQGDNVDIAGDSLYYSTDDGFSWTFMDTCMTGSYQWVVPGTPASYCRVKVVAWDAAGNKAADVSQAAFAINQTDVVAPRLHCVTADTARMSYGSDFTFRVHANDNSGIARVRLYWRPGGSNAAPDSAVMYNYPPDTLYVYPLPAAQIPLQGLSYRLAAWDSAGNVTRHPAAGYLLHSVYLSQLAMSQAYVNDKWKMVSFPADIDQRAVANLLTDDLGAYDIYKWRLYEYQADHYVEHGAAAFRPGAVGRAYWLRQKVGASIVLDAENLETVSSSDSTVSIPLVAQWTDVGNPFLFPVSWADVKSATGADTSKILGIYTYSGDGWVFPVTGQMSPWEGYCLRVSAAGTLRIPMRAAKAGDSGEGGWPDGWRGTVTVYGGGKRDDNFFGIGSGTSAGLDRYDYPEPPSGLTKISGWFEVDGQDCGADLRPSLGEGQSWAFSSSGREGDLALAVDLPPEVLKGRKCYWADLSEGMYEEVGPGFCYRYRSGSADERRDFRLILGSPEYALAELDRSLTIPGATALLQNRPNPFGGSTEIRYHLASPGRVRITVYNVIGQQVRTLVDGEKRAGRYRTVWDGRDQNGRRLGAGVYLCRLDVGGAAHTRRMALVR